jgi:rhomboid family GlyGly-CTERM serine protease
VIPEESAVRQPHDSARCGSWIDFTRGMMRQTLSLFPAGTLLLAAAAAAATLVPVLGRALVDTREAVERLEPWRPWTGHLVHGTLAHLALNLGALVPLGLLREHRRGTTAFLLECAAIAACVAAGIRLLHPSWTSYCGLSGVVYGLLALVLLDGPSGSTRWMARGAVAALALKSALEYRAGGWLTNGGALEDLLGVVFLPGSHCAGLAAGVAVALLYALPSGAPAHAERKARAASPGSAASRSDPTIAAPAAPAAFTAAAWPGVTPPRA